MTATSSDKLDSVVRQIHSSVGEECGWGKVLRRIRDLLRGRTAVFAKHDFLNGHSQQLFESPDSPSLKDAYTEHHTLGNPWFMSSMDYQTGRVITGAELLDVADLRRSDFYQRYLAPHGLIHWLCGVLSRHDDVVHYVAVHRAKTQAAFNEDDKALLTAILRHLKIGFQNHWALLAERSANNLLAEVADRLAAAVFIVDRNARILIQNEGARSFLAHYEELDIVDSRISATSGADNKALLKAISAVTNESSPATDGSERIVTVGGDASSPAFFVVVRRGGKHFDSEAGEYRNVAVVIAKNPENQSRVDTCTFAKVYGLTPAQARLTGLMLSGHSRSDAAKELNVSENTIRSHLKRIYYKTNTHGQMELVQFHSKVCTDH